MKLMCLLPMCCPPLQATRDVMLYITPYKAGNNTSLRGGVMANDYMGVDLPWTR